MDRLIREDNERAGYTWEYEYDNNGNILSEKKYSYTLTDTDNATPISENVYSYTNPDWKDQLSSFNGGTIVYDEIGNPTTYWDDSTFVWDSVNNLVSITNSAIPTTYTYNDNGIRTSKTVNGVKHTYTLEGSRIISEEYGSNLFTYIYDEAGSIIGFVHSKENSSNVLEYKKYFFTKNLQGDIISIYAEDGTEIGGYTYNAWGELRSLWSLTDYADLIESNPFRYRGYYYDTETGYYYLNSRYYDPQVKRFISPDNLNYLGANGDLNSYNLYAYCSNNPVMYADPMGTTIGAALLGIGAKFLGVLSAALPVVAAVVVAVVVVAIVVSAVVWIANEIEEAPTLEIAQEDVDRINGKHPGEYTVYSLIDPDTREIKYVGRTKNYEARMNQHKNSEKTKDLIPKHRIDNLSYSEARGMEQIGIVYYNMLELGKNSINGVSPKNKNRSVYLRVAYDYLYNVATNEWYNIFGV